MGRVEWRTSGVLGRPKPGLVGGEVDHWGRWDEVEGLRGAKEVDGRGNVRLSSRPRAERCLDSNRPASISNRGQPQKFTVVRCVTVTETVTGCVSPSHGHVIVPWNFCCVFRGKTFIEGGVTSRKHVSDGRDARQFTLHNLPLHFAACKR